MKKCKLTEKNMSDKRFYRTERAIFIAYYKLRDYPSAKKIAKKAKISHSTFYRHHQTANNIPNDHEAFLLKVYTNQMKKFLKNNDNLKTIFLRFLVFISNNKEVIKLLFTDGRKEAVKKMLSQLKPLVICEWCFKGDLDKAYNVYENEILGIIEFWVSQNFSTSYLNKTLNDILYLTKTAPKRLTPLIEIK